LLHDAPNVFFRELLIRKAQYPAMRVAILAFGVMKFIVAGVLNTNDSSAPRPLRVMYFYRPLRFAGAERSQAFFVPP